MSGGSSLGDRAERLYERARGLPPDARAGFLRQACRGRPDLRDELLSLLERAGAAEDFFELLEGALASADLSGGGGPGGPRDPGGGEAPAARDPPPPEPRLPPGHTVGRYRIVEWIGAGGMGSVYRARDTRLGRDVALKFLPARPGAGDGPAEERLLAEARAAAALEHPNVCTVHEIGETGDGRAFIAMAFYRGETLEARLRRGPLPPAEAADVAAQVARGLAAAHARGIVHRDVKPGNVMLAAEGPVRLLDFGLAAAADARPAGGGDRRGTVAYMSPEQARGETPDPRSDLWSLGVVLYEMLAGRKPFGGRSRVGLLHAILHGEPEPLAARAPETPGAPARIVERLLHKEPGDRYPDAEALLDDLARALPAADRPPAGRVAAAGRRRALAAAGGGAALVAGLAALALWPPAGETGTDGTDAAPAAAAVAGGEPSRGGTPDVAAHELYLRAGDQSLFRSDAGNRRGVRLLEEAIALDSTYAPAHARLAVLATILSGRDEPGRPVPELEALARRSAGRAVALDGSLAEAHAALGLVRQYLDADLPAAAASLERAVDLDPAHSTYRQWLAQLHLLAGRTREALAHARRAHELDPLSATAHAELAHALVANGRPDEALARLREIAELRPPLLRTAAYVAQALAALGRWSEAVEAVRPPEGASADARTLGLYGHLLGRAGRRDEARQVLDALLDRWRRGTGRAFEVGLAYAGLGDADRALAWLERAVEDGSAVHGNLHVMSPILRELREDPRFGRLAARLGVRVR